MNIIKYKYFNKKYYKLANNILINDNNDDNIYNHYYKNGIKSGLICSKYQILNFYKNCQIIEENDYIKIRNNGCEYLINDFCNLFFYKIPLTFFNDKLNILFQKLKNSELVIILHIGDNDVGYTLLNKIFENNYLKDCCIAINLVYFDNDIINFIKDNFKNYLITKSINFGTDIQSSNILFNILKNNIKFDFVFKIHTKTNIIWRYLLLQPFFNINIKLLIEFMILFNYKLCGSDEYSYYIKKDIYCKDILNDLYNSPKITELINKSDFIGGTIFLCTIDVYENTLKRIKKNERINFINCFYYKNNEINESPIHAVERVYGIENYLLTNKNLLKIKHLINNYYIKIFTLNIFNQKDLIKLINIFKNINTKYTKKIILVTSYFIDNNFDKNIIFNFFKKNIQMKIYNLLYIYFIQKKSNIAKLFLYIRRLKFIEKKIKIIYYYSFNNKYSSLNNNLLDIDIFLSNKYNIKIFNYIDYKYYIFDNKTLLILINKLGNINKTIDRNIYDKKELFDSIINDIINKNNLKFINNVKKIKE